MNHFGSYDNLDSMKLDIPSIKNAYRRYAKYYNFYFGWIFHPGRQTAVELINSQNGSKILEVGVGTGLSLPLYPKYVTVYGIDISPEMLKYARDLVRMDGLENVAKLEVMNAEEMTFPDNMFDTVVAMYVATVVPSPKKFIKEIRRVCKPGGRIIILNHFNQPETIGGKLVSNLSPLSKVLGFRPNLSLREFMEETALPISNKISVNLFGFWTILIAENDK